MIQLLLLLLHTLTLHTTHANDVTSNTASSSSSSSSSTQLKSFNFGTDAVTENLNNDFLKWYLKIGGRANGVTVGHDGTYGRGVYATQAVNEDDKIISVPLTWCLCRESAMNDPSKYAQAAYRQIEDDDDLVCCVLFCLLLCVSTIKKKERIIYL